MRVRVRVRVSSRVRGLLFFFVFGVGEAAPFSPAFEVDQGLHAAPFGDFLL